MRHSLISALSSLFFFNDTATTEIYTLSLHDALPIYIGSGPCATPSRASGFRRARGSSPWRERRSEEHTSELQSRLHLVCRLLLEKKKKCTKAEIKCIASTPVHAVRTDGRGIRIEAQR